MAQDDPNAAAAVLEKARAELSFQKPSRDSPRCEMLWWSGR